jgi:hypothetical protein
MCAETFAEKSSVETKRAVETVFPTDLVDALAVEAA